MKVGAEIVFEIFFFNINSWGTSYEVF